jgi:CHASE2 domain-containing sensor protein
MINKRFWLDTVIGTGWIFFFMFFLAELFVIFDFLDPIEETFDDMEITDLVFSRLREEPMADTNIVVVNFGNLSREGIAEQINILNQYKPKAIGIDALFFSEKDPEQDYKLAQALSQVENVVLVSKLVYVEEDDTFSILEANPLFLQHAGSAYANLTTPAIDQDDLKTCRSFIPRAIADGEERVAFAVGLARIYAPDKAEAFLKRGKETEVINFRGNVADNYNSGIGGKFFVLDWFDVFEENFTPDLIKDKIVLMGFLGSDLKSKSWEDKFCTPLNTKYIGRANPDMFGVVIHANILSMILNEDFISEMGDTAGFVFAVLMTFLNVILFSLIYKMLPRWYDGLTKVIQLLEVMLLFTIIIFAFHWFNVKLNFQLTILAVVLSGDLLEVYYGVISNLFTVAGRKRIFRVKTTPLSVKPN